MAPAADSTGSDMSDSDAAPQSRSRSQSRRARRRKQSTSGAAKTPKGKQQPNMPSVPEGQQASAQSQAQAGQGAQQAQAQSEAQSKPLTVEDTGMQPFEWIGPDETSMSGPVTYAKAKRGEIAPRPGNPQQALRTADPSGGSGGSDLMSQEGLKLRLELNLDIEIELKARIQGDLTLALLA